MSKAHTTAVDRCVRFIPVGMASEECWPWMGMKNSKGYGRITDRGRRLAAHRVVYKRFVRDIPDDLVIDHLCRRRDCVNPAHLEPVDNRENILRGIGPSARASRATHCPSGHKYDNENTCLAASGERKCRACARAYWHRKQLSKRSASEPSYENNGGM